MHKSRAHDDVIVIVAEKEERVIVKILKQAESLKNRIRGLHQSFVLYL